MLDVVMQVLNTGQSELAPGFDLSLQLDLEAALHT